MYETGRGVKRSDAKAAEWYRKAAQQGMPKAQCNLGVMHDRGRGSVVAQNDALAARYYRAAAEQGLALTSAASLRGDAARPRSPLRMRSAPGAARLKSRQSVPTA